MGLLQYWRNVRNRFPSYALLANVRVCQATHDHSGDQERHDARVVELRAQLMTVMSYHEATVAAEERASMERYMRCPLWLPTPGLDKLRKELEAEGFIFGVPERTRTTAYIPKGWMIIPRSFPTGSAHAALLDPTGETRAVIYYRDSVTGDSFATGIERP